MLGAQLGRFPEWGVDELLNGRGRRALWRAVERLHLVSESATQHVAGGFRDAMNRFWPGHRSAKRR